MVAYMRRPVSFVTPLREPSNDGAGYGGQVSSPSFGRPVLVAMAAAAAAAVAAAS